MQRLWRNRWTEQKTWLLDFRLSESLFSWRIGSLYHFNLRHQVRFWYSSYCTSGQDITTSPEFTGATKSNFQTGPDTSLAWRALWRWRYHFAIARLYHSHHG